MNFKIIIQSKTEVKSKSKRERTNRNFNNWTAFSRRLVFNILKTKILLPKCGIQFTHSIKTCAEHKLTVLLFDMLTTEK